MNKRIATDSEMQTLLKGGVYFKKYRKICEKKTPYAYQNWREDVKTEIRRLVNGNECSLKVLKEMLQCLCEKDKLDKSTSGLFNYGTGVASVFIPGIVIIIQIFCDFSSDLVKMQNDATGKTLESMQMLQESFLFSISELAMVFSLVVLLLWGLNMLQGSIDHRVMMYKRYNQELLEIVKSIEVSADDSK